MQSAPPEVSVLLRRALCGAGPLTVSKIISQQLESITYETFIMYAAKSFETWTALAPLSTSPYSATLRRCRNPNNQNRTEDSRAKLLLGVVCFDDYYDEKCLTRLNGPRAPTRTRRPRRRAKHARAKLQRALSEDGRWPTKCKAAQSPDTRLREASCARMTQSQEQEIFTQRVAVTAITK